MVRLASEISLNLFNKVVINNEKVSNRSIEDYFKIVDCNIYIEKQENLNLLTFLLQYMDNLYM